MPSRSAVALAVSSEMVKYETPPVLPSMGRRGMKVSVATAARYESAACDERDFSSSEERALAPLGLPPPRSAVYSFSVSWSSPQSYAFSSL